MVAASTSGWIAYERRTPEARPLYRVLSQHLETFLARTRTADRQLPSYVERELRAYLACGILAYGFMRVRCDQCGQSRAVAFSCKRRGFCPGCLGRRMADTAARLADEVIPPVPVRQWVLSLPFEIRYRLAWDGELVSAVLAVFLRVVQGWYRHQAKNRGRAEGRCGAVTLVQRFGSALNLNPHFHVLTLDGIYVTGTDGEPEFVAAEPIRDEDVQQIVETTSRRVVRLCQRRGLLEEGATDALWEKEPLLSTLTAAAVQGRVATGERAGQRVRRRLVDPPEGVRAGPLCFAAAGFSLHAATRIAADHRHRLEQLCRYVMRPPLASDRLHQLDADTLTYTLKTPWADGTTHLVLSPLELIEKLAALVPPPRLHLIRYHGVLAPNAADRAAIVAGLPAVPDEETCNGRHSGQGQTSTYRRSWATLLARVFRIDVTTCPDCGGPMKIIAALTDPSSSRHCLQGMGLPARAPPIAPAQPDPQPQFDYA